MCGVREVMGAAGVMVKRRYDSAGHVMMVLLIVVVMTVMSMMIMVILMMGGSLEIVKKRLTFCFL